VVAGSAEDRVLAHVERLTQLPAIHRQLVSATRVSALLARAVELACPHCGFDRGVVLAVGAGELIAAESEAIADPASDKLRRLALAHPIALKPGTDEAEAIRGTEGGGKPRPAAAGLMQETLSLEHHAIGVVAPESRALALLVLDRHEPPVDALDRSLVEAFAAMLALAVEHVVLRARIGAAGLELRHLTVSAQALMSELSEAPVTLPADRRHRSAFPSLDTVDAGLLAPTPLHELLSERELVIASLLAEGRSNREIAEQLILSPETVKTHVARILRKLNASNRAEAVSRYVRLAQAPPA
jgi:DNA-binding CsgD family transcriptional regulator